MKIALTQMDIVWECPNENKTICERLIRHAHENQCQWIVFPEMTLTGFSMHPERFFEPVQSDAPVHSFFRQLSLQYSIGIVFGYIAEADGRYYSHLAMVENGIYLMEYAKIHPFSYGEEANYYTGGDRIVTCHMEPSICVSGFVCYDLRFPEVFQAASQSASVIFVIANWPMSRITHWYTLLQARAIENQCFMIGVNRTGNGGGLCYCPSSIAFDPYGKRISQESNTELLCVDIQPEQAAAYRSEFPVQADRRKAVYSKLYTP